MTTAKWHYNNIISQQQPYEHDNNLILLTSIAYSMFQAIESLWSPSLDSQHHLLYETSVISLKVSHLDYKHRCLVENNVPTALILPSRWQYGAESLGIEHFGCLCPSIYAQRVFTRLATCQGSKGLFLSANGRATATTTYYYLDKWSLGRRQTIVPKVTIK